MKKKNLRLALLCAGMLACGVQVGAQSVYRCGTSYSQQPCPGGKEVVVEDERSAAQRAQTEKAAQRDAKAADAMEKARLKEEARPAQALLPLVKAEEEERRREKSASARAKKLEHFSAVSPRKQGDPPAKKKSPSRKKAD